MIAYLSHSLATGNGDAQVLRHDNIANALAWLEFLVEATPWIVIMPWYPHAIVLRELWRDRMHAGDLEVMARLDALVFVGGIVSRRMEAQRAHAIASAVGVIDLTDLGMYPPRDLHDGIREALAIRARDALDRARRGV